MIFIQINHKITNSYKSRQIRPNEKIFHFSILYLVYIIWFSK